MRYNAGSEMYTQGLSHALAERHEVHVFTRQEDSFLPEYTLRTESDHSEPLIAGCRPEGQDQSGPQG